MNLLRFLACFVPAAALLSAFDRLIYHHAIRWRYNLSVSLIVAILLQLAIYSWRFGAAILCFFAGSLGSYTAQVRKYGHAYLWPMVVCGALAAAAGYFLILAHG